MITTLSQLIGQVESNGNPWAIRFEPAYKPRFVSAMMAVAKCSEETATVLCACSFGTYQIMGDELMSMGLAMSPLTYCANPDVQDDFFNKYCVLDHLSYTLADIVNDESKRLIFARLYNGPGEPDIYAARMMVVYNESLSAPNHA